VSDKERVWEWLRVWRFGFGVVEKVVDNLGKGRVLLVGKGVEKWRGFGGVF
jgi:hypothetical protein